MDPNETLRHLRGWADLVATNPGQFDEWFVKQAHSFQALDEWLQSGGFLPDAWSESAKFERDLTQAEILANQAIEKFPNSTVKALVWWRDAMGDPRPSLREARDAIYRAKGLPL